MASPSIPAVESTRSMGMRADFSLGMGMESVTTNSSSSASSRRSTAGPLNTGWVTPTRRLAAPNLRRMPAASLMEPPVAISSS